MSDYDAAAFDAYEASGWEAVACLFHDYWSSITSLGVDALLDAAGVEAGTRLVDVGTGSGVAAARAAERGAEATGVDVAAAMVDIAARRHSAVTFVRASVVDLPFSDESFDAAVGNVVIPHVGEPLRAGREVSRVLVPGGRIALSVWDTPERSPFFALILGAVEDADVAPPSEIPPGPSFFQFADSALFSELLADAGFRDIELGSITFEIPVRSAEELITALADGTVRTGALLRAAEDEQRARVRGSLERRLEPWRRGDSFAVPISMKIVSGEKPA
jgi:SAM-dependent methyltransferase